jgi:hypothetical protein
MAMTFLVLLVLFIYFMPTIFAGINKKQAGASILFVNVFLGWTVIGWIVCLIWSSGKDKK